MNCEASFHNFQAFSGRESVQFERQGVLRGEKCIGQGRKGGKNDRADSSFPMLKILDYRRSVALHMKRPYHAIRIEEYVILLMSTDWETLLFLIVFGIFSYFFLFL